MLFTVAGCGKKAPSATPAGQAVNVSVQKVVAGDASYDEEYPATVVALNQVELRAQISGYITGIHFKEGDEVKKGQKLYTIDPELSEAGYQQAKANLALQEANLEKAKKDLERYRELDKKDAISKQQVDYAETAYETAQKQVDAAHAQVQGMETNVRYTIITAPFDGTIGISQVRLGAAVTPGQTVLNTISSDNPMAVDIPVEQGEIYRFTQLLASRSNSPADSTFRLKLGDGIYPEYGKISIIDRAVDPQTGTIRMRLVFANPRNTLRAGMTGTIQIRTELKNALLIPYKAVTEQLGEFFVYVADGSKATQKRVTLGQQTGRDIIVKDGLQEGETVITEGIQSLHEGTPINISEAEQLGK